MTKTQFPLKMYVDDDYRENTLKGITFKQLSADQDQDLQNKNMELGIEWC